MRYRQSQYRQTTYEAFCEQCSEFLRTPSGFIQHSFYDTLVRQAREHVKETGHKVRISRDPEPFKTPVRVEPETEAA